MARFLGLEKILGSKYRVMLIFDEKKSKFLKMLVNDNLPKNFAILDHIFRSVYFYFDNFEILNKKCSSSENDGNLIRIKKYIEVMNLSLL